MPLPEFRFPDGSTLVAQQMIEPKETSPFEGMEQDDIIQLVETLWRDAFEEKRPETERLQRNSSYYDGFHYENAWLNRSHTIENQCYRVVETQLANSIAVRPRPEIMPQRSMPDDVAERLQDFASWLMEQDSFDEAVYLAARDKAIFGWSVWLIAFDFRTGMPYPKMCSVFDLYKDPAGRNDDEIGYLQIAMPVGTAGLRAHFPAAAAHIRPDHIASPSYEAVVRPWRSFLEAGGVMDPEIGWNSKVVHQEGETPTDSTALVYAPAEKMEHGVTTFLLQTFIRDETMEDVKYIGQLRHVDGTTLEAMDHVASRPRCESGWWQIDLTGGRCLLRKPTQVDPCYLGLPIVVDRAKQRTDRYWSGSDLDQVIPMQRALNRDNANIDHAIELLSNPPLLADRQSGIRAQLNNGPVMGGETLDIQRGSDVRYLEYRGPQGQHFERVQSRRQMIQAIAGNHDSMEGAKPAGVEAASALRQLDDSARRRLRGQENPAHRARSQLLRKLMYAAGKKLQPEIAFRAAAGDTSSVKSDELLHMFSIRMVPGTGTIEGRQELEDKALALYDRQVIDEAAVLDTLQWPNRAKIVARVEARKMKELVAQTVAAVSAKGSASTNGSSSKSGSRIPAGR